MTAFSTPEPIWASIDIAVGDLRVTAADRDETVVQVTPSDTTVEADRLAAEQTRVQFEDGRLSVAGPKRRASGLARRTGSIDVAVSVPTDSRVDAATSVGGVYGAGRLGACRIKTSAGDIRLQDTAGADLTTGIGAVEVENIGGQARCTTGSGAVRIGSIDAGAQVKNSNGDTWLGEVHGDLRIKAANGDICVDRARGDVDATTANGSIRLGQLERGRVGAKTSLGQIELAIAPGTVARLDLHTSFGTVHNNLDGIERPGPDQTTVEVNAETSYGDIVVRRARTDES